MTGPFGDGQPAKDGVMLHFSRPSVRDLSRVARFGKAATRSAEPGAFLSTLHLSSDIGSDKHPLKLQRSPVSASAKCRKDNGQRWQALAVGSYQACALTT
jgi:hypothetical protein